MMNKVKHVPNNPARSRGNPRLTSAIAAAMFASATLPASADAASAGSGAPPGGKSEYHLFNPTPRHLLREMSTDRPDVTESPYTVDAGHVQVELSFVEWGRDDAGGGMVEELSVLPSNFKIGLTNYADLQLVASPYVDLDAPGFDASGFGETQLRLKVNVWGNDGPDARFGDTALAVMPFVQFPTGDEDLGFADELEGGVIIPFATALPRGFSLSLMAEFDFVRNDADDGYDVDFVHTASVGLDLVGDLAGYVEYIGVAGSGDGAAYSAGLGAGLTYGITPDVQLDGGVIVGLNDAADDVRLFTGISLRL